MFSGPKLKVERAKQHIHDLNNALIAFLNSGPGRIRVDHNSDGRTIIILDTQPLSDIIPLILGDAVHNLRASLDLMACEIVTMAGGTPSRYCNFPIRDNRNELVGAVNSGEIKIAGQNICDLITDVIKPYDGGNDPIWALNKIDIIDKHRLIIPVVGLVQLAGASYHTDNGIVFSNVTLQQQAGDKLNIISIPQTGVYITNHGQPTVGVFFPEDSVFKGQPLVPTLVQLTEVVSGVIQAIEEAYLAKP